MRRKIKIDTHKIATKRFDACVCPTLMYGAEIWGANESVDVDTWDTLPLEQTHLQFCKRSLGVNRSTVKGQFNVTSRDWKSTFGSRH